MPLSSTNLHSNLTFLTLTQEYEFKVLESESGVNSVCNQFDISKKWMLMNRASAYLFWKDYVVAIIMQLALRLILSKKVVFFFQFHLQSPGWQPTLYVG